MQFVAPVPERGRSWRRLRRALWPRDRRFYVLLNQHAALCVEGLHELTELMRDVSDQAGRVRGVESAEKRADQVVDEVQALLARSLFPPFARAVVHDLVNSLDDVLDLSEDCAQSLHLYHITRLTPDALRLAELALDSAGKLQQAVAGLGTLHSPAHILALCAEVDALEAQADHVMRAAMARLFRDEPDARQLLKLKAIYELLEGLTDKCKDVANEIEAIVLKYG